MKNYSINIEQETIDNRQDYSILSAFGYRVKESSNMNFKQRPQTPIELYEFEGCPFCRKVREAVTLLDLDVVFYPCPRGGPTFRQKVKQMGGKAQFPYMVDTNSGVTMYESADIIQYLFDTYGDGSEVPTAVDASFLTTMSCSIAMLPRMGRGSKFEESKPAEKPIIFWGYESSPFCKIVRERLVELELPHLQRTCGRGSVKRSELFQKTGIFQVPYIEDPNTGVKLFESSDILNYLDKVYSAAGSN